MSEPKRPLRIVIASEFYRPARGGTERTTENLARGLTELGHEVLVVAPGGSIMRSRLVEDDDGQRVLRVRSMPFPTVPHLRASLWPYRDLERYVSTFEPDIIQVNNHFMLGQALLRYGQRYHVPVVAGLHFMPETLLFNLYRLSPALFTTLAGAWWRRIARRYNQATLVVGPSRTAVDYLVKAGLNTATAVVSNGTDLDRFKSSTPQQAKRRLGLPNRPVVLYAGRLSPEKQLDVIVHGFALAISEVDAELVIVGSGWTRSHLQRLVKHAGLAARTRFAGYVSEEQKYDYFQAADVFVMPSSVELQSMVTLEAMAGGTAVVGAAAGAIPELVEPGVNGELFAVRDSQELAQKLTKLLQDKQLLQRYGHESRRKVMAHQLADMPKNYLHLYRGLIKTD